MLNILKTKIKKNYKKSKNVNKTKRNINQKNSKNRKYRQNTNYTKMMKGGSICKLFDAKSYEEKGVLKNIKDPLIINTQMHQHNSNSHSHSNNLNNSITLSKLLDKNKSQKKTIISNFKKKNLKSSLRNNEIIQLHILSLQTNKHTSLKRQFINQHEYTPLVNNDSLCYLNSAIQIIFSIPEFRDLLSQLTQQSIIALNIDYEHIKTDKEIELQINQDYKVSALKYTQSFEEYRSVQLPLLIQSRNKLKATKITNINKKKNSIYALHILNNFFIPGITLDIDNNQKNNNNDITETIYNNLYVGQKYSSQDPDQVIRTFLEYIKIIDTEKKYMNLIKYISISIEKGNSIQEIINYFLYTQSKNNLNDNLNSFSSIPPKYIIFVINRFNTTNNDKIKKKLIANMFIINNNKYILKACIIQIKHKRNDNGHYIYLNFNKDLIPKHIIDDSSVYNYNGNTNVDNDYLTSGYIYLYENII